MEVQQGHFEFKWHRGVWKMLSILFVFVGAAHSGAVLGGTTLMEFDTGAGDLTSS